MTATPTPAPAVIAAKRKEMRDQALGYLAVLIFFALWEAAYRWEWSDPLFISGPSAILKAGFALFKSGSMWKDLRVSALEFAAGYGMAVLIGIPLGIATGWYRTFNKIVEPFVSALYATPRIALLPLLIIWAGIGVWSKIWVVFLGAFFQIVMSTHTGVRTLDPQLLKAARSFGASDACIFRTIALPGSVPHILTGLRLAVGRGLIGIVTGELYAATAGVGFLIAQAGNAFQTDKVFVGVIIIAVSGVIMDRLLRRLEERFDRWRPQRPA